MKLTEIEAVAEEGEESDELAESTIKEIKKITRKPRVIKGLVSGQLGELLKKEIEAKEKETWHQFHKDSEMTSYSNKQIEDYAA